MREKDEKKNVNHSRFTLHIHIHIQKKTNLIYIGSTGLHTHTHTHTHTHRRAAQLSSSILRDANALTSFLLFLSWQLHSTFFFNSIKTKRRRTQYNRIWKWRLGKRNTYLFPMSVQDGDRKYLSNFEYFTKYTSTSSKVFSFLLMNSVDRMTGLYKTNALRL